jgi:purple acid phosphatase-like protein
VPLPTTTKPEQLLLTWGADPARDVTVSWSAPGTVPQPAPVLAVSARPITAGNPGRLIKLPDPKPLDVTQRYGEAASVSFTDTLNGQTTYCFHVQLKGLKPATRYYWNGPYGSRPAPRTTAPPRCRPIRPRRSSSAAGRAARSAASRP